MQLKCLQRFLKVDYKGVRTEQTSSSVCLNFASEQRIFGGMKWNLFVFFIFNQVSGQENGLILKQFI